MGQLEDIKIFVRVAETNSISKTAEQLNIGKSMVSRKLAALESHLGVSLISRTTRRLQLTEAGHTYYRRCVAIVDELSELDQTVSAQSGTLSGSLHLAAPLSFGRLHLMPILDEFIKTHPNINLHVSFSDKQQNLVEEGIDLALRIAELKDSSLRAKKIAPITVRLCASPEYLTKHGRPQDLAALSEHQILHYNHTTPFFEFIDPANNPVSVSYTPYISSNNGEFLSQLAVNGHGIALLPTFITWQSIAMGELEPVLPHYTTQSINAWLVYPNTRFVATKTRALIDFIAQRLGSNPYWEQALSNPPTAHTLDPYNDKK